MNPVGVGPSARRRYAIPVPARASQSRRRPKGLAARNDAALVEACLKGDEDAWNELVERFGRLVYSIARRYGLSEANAEDVFQTVFIILYRKLNTIRDQSRLSAWLIRTTHRECYRVGKSARGHAELDHAVVDVSAPAEEEASTWEIQHLVRRALCQLGGRCEQLLTALFLASGQPNYESIADQLGIKVGSIGPTRARCFEKLEKILVDMGLPEGIQAQLWREE